MLNTETVRNAGRSPTTYFVLAAAFLVIGGIANPLFLAVALGFIAAGLAVRRDKQDIFHGAVLFAFVVLAFGYSIGKDLAHRDNVRSASASADGA
jgi:cytochrome bd-type quinol oxidase subunit 2